MKTQDKRVVLVVDENPIGVNTGLRVALRNLGIEDKVILETLTPLLERSSNPPNKNDRAIRFEEDYPPLPLYDSSASLVLVDLSSIPGGPLSLIIDNYPNAYFVNVDLNYRGGRTSKISVFRRHYNFMTSSDFRVVLAEAFPDLVSKPDNSPRNS